MINLTDLFTLKQRNLTTWETFTPRVINKTDITFSSDELALLNKGLKYNPHHKHKNWIKTLALEAETAITLLPIYEQDHIRHQVAYNIKRLYKQQKMNTYTIQYNTCKKREESHKPNQRKTNC
jgi:hypothetical protein